MQALLVLLALLEAGDPVAAPRRRAPHLEVNTAALRNEIVVTGQRAPEEPNVLRDAVRSRPVDLGGLTGGLVTREERAEPASADGHKEQRIQTSEAISFR